jgi:hypothetical protein
VFVKDCGRTVHPLSFALDSFKKDMSKAHYLFRYNLVYSFIRHEENSELCSCSTRGKSITHRSDVVPDCSDVVSDCSDVVSDCSDVVSDCSDVVSDCSDVVSGYYTLF